MATPPAKVLKFMSLEINGGVTKENYTRILTDPSFGRRLKAFDKNLELFFDNGKKKWVVMEAVSNGTWNLIVTCEHEDGTPKPVGDWIFNRLFVFRARQEAKQQVGVDTWLKQMRAQVELQDEMEQQKLSDNHQAHLREDVIQWRKGSYEMKGKPKSDAIAGYRKWHDIAAEGSTTQGSMTQMPTGQKSATEGSQTQDHKEI